MLTFLISLLLFIVAHSFVHARYNWHYFSIHKVVLHSTYVWDVVRFCIAYGALMTVWNILIRPYNAYKLSIRLRRVLAVGITALVGGLLVKTAHKVSFEEYRNASIFVVCWLRLACLCSFAELVTSNSMVFVYYLCFYT